MFLFEFLFIAICLWKIKQSKELSGLEITISHHALANSDEVLSCETFLPLYIINDEL